jgi:DNA repair protein RadD
MGYTLRYYQKECLEKCLASEKNGVCILPTGSGKTIVLLELAYRYAKPLIVTSRRKIRDQNREKASKKVEVHTIQWAARHAEEFDILIIDEAHLVRPLEGQYQKLMACAKRVVGFTATPFRLDTGHLVPEVFPNVIYEIDREALVGAGYLRRRNFIDIPLRFVINVRFHRKYESEEGTEKCLEHFLKNSSGRALVFGCDIGHCEKIEQHLGSESLVVTSRTAQQQREVALARFRSNDVKYLINCELYTIGYDDPSVLNLCILRPTDSHTLYEQMVGRGDRPHPKGIQILNNIYDYTVNRFNFSETASRNRKEKMSHCIFCMKLTDYRRMKCEHCGEKLIRGEAPTKICDACHAYNHPRAAHCKECGAFILKVYKVVEGDELFFRTFKKSDSVMFKLSHATFRLSLKNFNTLISNACKSDTDWVILKEEVTCLKNIKPLNIVYKRDPNLKCNKIIQVRMVL